MIVGKPTGKIRYRQAEVKHGWFGFRPVLVLQVHVKWEDGPPDSNGRPTYLQGEGWRDAMVEDFAELERLKHGAQYQ